jgi:hypothetical protein
VFTILKNISQWEGLSHILRKNKIHVPNHQPNTFGRAYIVSESDNARVKKHVRSRVECVFFKLVGKKKHTDDISLDIMGNPHEMRGG